MKTPPITKFLLCPDEINKELYILHREFPSCLIWVKQSLPITFIILDLYDDVENESDIVKMDFVVEAKSFFNNHIENTTEKN